MATIINELLCYVLNKIDILPQDTIVRLISENFNDDEVESAKSLLCSHVADSIKAGNRRGQNKKTMSIQDIYKMALECNREELPCFVALNLKKLPPVSVDCIDISALMHKQQVMEIDMSHMKTMIDDILRVSVDTSKRVETVLSSAKSNTAATSRAATAAAEQRANLAAPVRQQPSGSADPPSPPSSSAAAPSADGSAAGQPCRAAADHGSSRQQPRRDDDDGAAASYASVAAAPAGPEAGWNVANRAKRGKPPAGKSTAKVNAAPKSVVGQQKTNLIKAVKSVKRMSLFVSRLPPDTDAKVVEEYAKEQVGAAAVVATKLKTRYESYESYRLDVTDPSVSDVLDPELWAQGLLVRRYFHKKADPVTTDVPVTTAVC